MSCDAAPAQGGLPALMSGDSSALGQTGRAIVKSIGLVRFNSPRTSCRGFGVALLGLQRRKLRVSANRRTINSAGSSNRPPRGGSSCAKGRRGGYAFRAHQNRRRCALAPVATAARIALRWPCGVRFARMSSGPPSPDTQQWSEFDEGSLRRNNLATLGQARLGALRCSPCEQLVDAGAVVVMLWSTTGCHPGKLA